MALLNTASTLLSGLSLRLVQDRLLSQQDAERIQSEVLNNKVSFVTQLVDSKKPDSASIARAASDAFGIPLFEIDAPDLEAAPIKLLDEKIIRRYRVLPFFQTWFTPVCRHRRPD